MKSKKQRVEKIFEPLVQNDPLSNFNMVNDVSTEERFCHSIKRGPQNNDFWKSIPPGYRFCPTEEELIMAYLKKKVMNEPLQPNQIMEVEVYKYNPEQLSKQYKSYGEKEWYFFSPRDRRYPNGNRPKRSTQDGYWNASGRDQSILSHEGSVIGKWRTLVYYAGNRQNGRKTNWIMREYHLDGPTHKRIGTSDMKLDDWVLCKIYKNAKKYKNSSTHSPIMEVDESIECSGEGTSFLNPKTSQPIHFYHSSLDLSQPQLQLQNNDIDTIVGSELMMEPIHLNPSSSEIPQPRNNNAMMESMSINSSSEMFQLKPQPQCNNEVAIVASESNPPPSIPEIQGEMVHFDPDFIRLLQLESDDFTSTWNQYPIQGNMENYDNFGILPESQSFSFLWDYALP